MAYVACRTAGVELIDVSEPRRPVHLSTIRGGVAQVVVHDENVLIPAGYQGLVVWPQVGKKP